MLKQMAETLESLGFRRLEAAGLKPRHVDALVDHWHTEVSARTGRLISTGAIKNRMSHLRWWARQVGKPNMIPKNNDALGIARRVYASNVSRAQTLSEAHKALIPCPYIRASLALQAAFGLRREEAMKIQPDVADKGDFLHLQGSWCKGGRPRSVPILTDSQRVVLDHAKVVASNGSMIPAHLSYAQHLRSWSKQTTAAGLPHTHSLRHAYAQERYLTLTGNHAPIAGGRGYYDLSTAADREVDNRARRQIALELGHVRISITNVYLGR